MSNNLTEEEKQKLQIISDTCNNLLEKIIEVQKEIEHVENTVNSYDITTITSADKSKIEILIQDMDLLIQSTNLTEEEKSAIGELKTTVTALLEKIVLAQDAFNAKEIKDIEQLSENTVNSTNNATLEKAKDIIELALKEYSNNYTEEEKQKLQTVLDTCNNLLEKIIIVQKELKRVETMVNNYDIDMVTSNDKSEIEMLIQDMDVFMQSTNLTEEEKNTINDLKVLAAALLEKILLAQTAVSTEEIKAVEIISKDTVNITDKDSLEKAKNAIEMALKEYNSHYTEKEKQEIEANAVRITEALESIEKIETVVDVIFKLPSADSVSPDDIDIEVAAKQAENLLETLTEHEKSFVDTKKLVQILAALTDYKILEGDGNKWIKESDRSVTFKANGHINKFINVLVDGKTVDKENYIIKAGSTIIIFNESYLNTLSVGNHNLTICYSDGETSAVFEIEANESDDDNPEPSKPDDGNDNPKPTQPDDNNQNLDNIQPDNGNQNSPQTGDQNNLLLWFVLLAFSSFGIIIRHIYYKKISDFKK